MVRRWGTHREDEARCNGEDSTVAACPVGGELQWPAAPVGRPCNTRGPRRGEGRSTTRTTSTGGVS
jgi:hypothetical protein